MNRAMLLLKDLEENLLSASGGSWYPSALQRFYFQIKLYSEVPGRHAFCETLLNLPQEPITIAQARECKDLR